MPPLDNPIEYLIANPPICDVCSKKVDASKVERDPMSDGRIYKVACHGEVETTYLSELDLEKYGHDIQVGRAFVSRELQCHH